MQLIKTEIKGLNFNKEKNTFGLLVSLNEKETWLNGWASSRTSELNKGETVYLWVFEEEYNGKTYLKFRLPSIDFLLGRDGEDKKYTKEDFIPQVVSPTQSPGNEEEKSEIKVEDIPF